MKLLWRLLVAGSLASVLAITVSAGSTGYWGGERNITSDPFYRAIYTDPWIYPASQAPGQQTGFCSFASWRKCTRPERYAPLRWQSPLTWSFENSPYHTWTSSEKTVAREAIGEWRDVCSSLGLEIREISSASSADVRLRWDSSRHALDNDANSYNGGSGLDAIGMYMPDPTFVAPAYANLAGLFTHLSSSYGLRTGVVLLNADYNGSFSSTWTVRRASEAFGSYAQARVVGCDAPSAWLALRTALSCKNSVELKQRIASGQVPPFSVIAEAPAGTSAASRWDLRSVVAHEFGHALGLRHSGGCVGCTVCEPWENEETDRGHVCDAGSIMHGGELNGSLRGGNPPTECQRVGLGEMRAVQGWTILAALLDEYGGFVSEFFEETDSCVPCVFDALDLGLHCEFCEEYFDW